MNSEIEKLVVSGKITSAVGEKISLLEPGTYCHHKSWGVGKVQAWDLIAGQLEIDFEGKPGHTMKLEFAAKSLEILQDDHILARRLRELAALQALATEDPISLVTSCLQSYGGQLSLDQFENVLKGNVIADADYKKWWETTKKKLRKNHHFLVPSKRNEPLQLRQGEINPTEALISDFTAAKDLKAKNRALTAILKELDAFTEAPEELQKLSSAVNEAISRGRRQHLGQVIELIISRDQLPLPKEHGGVLLVDIIKEEEGRLAQALPGLPQAVQRTVYAKFPQVFAEDWVGRALSLMNSTGIRGITEISKLLLKEEKGEEMLSHLKKGLQQRLLNAELLSWVCKERQGATKALLTSELGLAVMNSLEKDHYDEDNRKRNPLKDLLIDDKELVPDLVTESGLNQARTFARRLLTSPVFDELTRRSLLARIIKLYPEVQEMITGKENTKEEEFIVSWESIERKKEELEELIKKKIPENTKEISIARSYGDLRENFEYKAAKQMQAVLLRRQNELERDLNRARGTDYAHADCTQVGIGTMVTIKDKQTEREEEYTILGAWDADPDQNVISYLSALGQALFGKALHDEVALPTEEPEVMREARVTAIVPYKKNITAS